MKLSLRFLLLVWAISTYSGCIVIDNPYTALPPGPWRGVLQLEPNPITPNPKGKPLPEKVNLTFEEVTAGELPFNFEVVYDSSEEWHIEIINGEERIRVNDIRMGIDRSTAKDTLTISFPVFDSYIEAIFEENVIEGMWHVRNRPNYAIPFVATHGKNHRFTTLQKPPALDLSGKWETTFEIEREKPYQAVGEFKQEGNYITGTFRTETGDYRFLQGTVQANKVYLSCFDGSHAFLFEAKIQEDSTLLGAFWSGNHYKTLWEAKRNEDFELPSPEELTYLKEGYDRVDFSFPNAEGKTVSLSDERFNNKIKIVQVFGTWCPNCRDETNYLLEFINNRDTKDIEIVGLAFERYQDPEKAQKAIHTYREKLNIPYEILHAGYYLKEEATKALPMFNQIISFPTLIVIDKADDVRYIHTGFTGPATSKYADFKETFETLITNLQAESPTAINE